MKKTFDQICADILGETVLTPTPKPTAPTSTTPATPASGQQTSQNQQQQGQQQQQADLNKIKQQLALALNIKPEDLEKALAPYQQQNAATANKPT